MMNLRRRVLLAVFCSLACSQALAATEPPTQPSSGPGGSEYRHAAVTKNHYGEGAEGYWLFEPSEPVPASASVIVFLHGWSGTNPRSYGAWIEHVVRRGNIVVYPTYQEPGSFRYPPDRITANAIQAVRDAIARLQSGGHVRPELDRFAMVGHSAGGLLSANLAALAAEAGLPGPKAVMSIQPGRSQTRAKRMAIPLEDMSRIPAGTLLLAVTGDADRICRDVDAKKIFLGSTQIPPENKDFIILVSDDHGEPPLHATHFAPVAVDARYDDGSRMGQGQNGAGQRGFLRSLIVQRIRQRIASRFKEDELPDMSAASRMGGGAPDALDFYGTWKLFDGLTDAAFYGRNRSFALGQTPEQRFMGTWSDGTPVKELIATDTP